MKIVLPLPPNKANTRYAHWAVEKKARDEYLYSCDVLKKVEGERSGHGNGRKRITAKLFLHSLMDADNLMARLKWPLDWLVANDYLRDDGPAHVEWAGLPSQAIDRKDKRVEFTIEATE